MPGSILENGLTNLVMLGHNDLPFWISYIAHLNYSLIVGAEVPTVTDPDRPPHPQLERI